jgi:2'-hydroxyisoflavone reductase
VQRRQFIKTSLYASVMAAFYGQQTLQAVVRPKRILVLGGTFFLGPAFVEAALGDGHSVTLFNRGVTNPQLFPYVEKLRGYRSPNSDDQNLDSIAERHWDVVVDVWPFDPDMVESAARMLKDRTEHYLYVSSVAAYDSKDFGRPGVAEDAELASWHGSARPYSRGKAESERRLHTILGDKLTIVRPGPIKGVRDDTPDMLTWLRRMQNCAEVIAPGDGSSPIELVDVKDVASFLIRAIDYSIFGTFNLTGMPISFREFLTGCKSATNSEAELVWIPKSFLQTQGMDTPDWSSNFPLWQSDSVQENFFRISSKKAFDAGWKTRPFRDTAVDYLTYIALLDPYIFRNTSDRDSFVFRDALQTAQQEKIINLWRNHGH